MTVFDQVWSTILQLTAQFVTPDWGKLIAFIPIGIAVIVAVVLVLLIRALRRQPKARRGKQRVVPATPAGIHMPGPSFSPAFAAVGVFLVLLGLVFGGLILVLGAIALVLTLLYWLAEGLRIYDKDIGPTVESLPAVVHEGPPPGVHMPGPSWQPFLGAFGVFLLFLGLVFGGWLLIVGVLALIATLVGWLTAALQEYRRTVEADRTGHLENGPAPRAPTALLTVLTAMVLGAAVLQVSNFSIGTASGTNASPGASGSPGAPASAPPTGSGAPAGSGAPPAATGDVAIHAQGIQFVESTVTGPANKPFTIAFTNEDAGTPHNIELQDGSGKVVFKGEVFNGVDTKIYNVPAQPAGAYKFSCTVHPTMTGTANLQ